MTDQILKKRLGQYFSGIRLAKLLAAIANSSRADSIIDPMLGSGDMLVACLELNVANSLAVGIEIDPQAQQIAAERLIGNSHPRFHLILGNAFDASTVQQLPTRAFDLVITNPPYVRYQSLSHPRRGELKLPSAVEIRKNMIHLVDEFPSLDQEDKALFKRLVSSYSGLSDLAVPSWLLCAMLTHVGGTLAMVVPEAWLSRDYAQVIQYLLLRWFKIAVVVEDANAAWFSDALVKTTLLVAERIERRDSAFSWIDEGYLHVRFHSQTITAESIVGNLFPADPNPEGAFAELLRQLAFRQGRTT